MNRIQVYQADKQNIQKEMLQKRKKKVDPIDSLTEKVTDIFSNIWNIMRFILFLSIAGYILILAISLFSAIPPGE